jgi:aspartate carbamoyltransferase catalytic subunit
VKQHLLSVADLGADGIVELLELTDHMAEVSERAIPKVPALRGKTVVMLFYEDSTRTRISFETAARRLSADTMNFSVSTSSVRKGESLLDTVHTIESMGIDAIVVRHGSAGAPHRIAQSTDASVINAGDGRHEHPTQALLDAFTLRQSLGTLENRVIAIVGDIAHSRVARSDIHCFTKLGAEVRVAGPPTMMPAGIEALGVKPCFSLEQALAGADVIVMLRIQQERLDGALFPSVREYSRTFGLTQRTLALAKPEAIVLHPGPINRGVEIASDVADAEPSRILDQVTNGVAVRMAVLYLLTGGQK